MLSKIISQDNPETKYFHDQPTAKVLFLILRLFVRTDRSAFENLHFTFDVDVPQEQNKQKIENIKVW